MNGPMPGGIGSLACYQCIDQVGEGTYGYVYKAKDRRSNETVALKRLIFNKEVSGFPLCAVREIKFLKSLRHKNVVQLKDVVSSKGYEHLELPVKIKASAAGTDTKASDGGDGPSTAEDDARDVLRVMGNLYFVFEFVEHDLGGLIDSKYKFTPRGIKCIMKQLFEVLDFLNDRKVVHRDIKSSNILINSRHQVKLADFGLARSLQSGDGREIKADMTNNVITLWYRPPELLMGAVRYTSAVDVWSTGCVLAELELLRPLFPGKTEADQLELICKALGTLGDETFPGVSKLPNYDNMLKNMPKYANAMKSLYAGRISTAAQGLLERILVVDPLRRSSAKIALTNKYFHSAPLPPQDPLELEPMTIAEGSNFHEYKTKLLKKEEREKALAEEKEIAPILLPEAQGADKEPMLMPPPPPPMPMLPAHMSIPAVLMPVAAAAPPLPPLPLPMHHLPQQGYGPVTMLQPPPPTYPPWPQQQPYASSSSSSAPPLPYGSVPSSSAGSAAGAGAGRYGGAMEMGAAAATAAGSSGSGSAQHHWSNHDSGSSSNRSSRDRYQQHSSSGQGRDRERGYDQQQQHHHGQGQGQGYGGGGGFGQHPHGDRQHGQQSAGYHHHRDGHPPQHPSSSNNSSSGGYGGYQQHQEHSYSNNGSQHGGHSRKRPYDR